MFHTLFLRKLLTNIFHQNKGIHLGIQVKSEENTQNDGEGNVGENRATGLERNQST